MPPAKKTAAQDDSSTSSKQTSTINKGKKPATASNLTGSMLKDATNVDDANKDSQNLNTGMVWNTEDTLLLERYRFAHKMDTPPAFRSAYNRALLTNPGIGRSSPTMARKRRERKVSKEQLALAVRKNFNSAAVNEVGVAVDLLYKIRNQDKAFRVRSNPSKGKTNP